LRITGIVNEVPGAVAAVSPQNAEAENETPQADLDFTAVLSDAIHEEETQNVIADGYPNDAYSALIADAMREEALRMSASLGAGNPAMMDGYFPLQSQGVEQMILTAASTGQVSDAQIALFMLCSLMQSNQGGEFPMLMQMMASMLTQIQEEADSLRNSVMSKDYDPYVLDTIDSGVFNTRTSSVSGKGGAILPVEAWRPTIPAITSNEGNRNPALYRAVINQFNVETAERYRPGRNDSTYCNIFVWDVTRAMGAEIPHYTDPKTGQPRYYPDTKGASSMGAIATDKWLRTYGEYYGWYETDAETAQLHANQGKPAITTAGSIGHVQVICPSRSGGYDPDKGVTVAQAGRIVTNYMHLSGTYGANGRKSVRYWIHD